MGLENAVAKTSRGRSALGKTAAGYSHFRLRMNTPMRAAITTREAQTPKKAQGSLAQGMPATFMPRMPVTSVSGMNTTVTDWYCPAVNLVMRQDIDQAGVKSAVEITQIK